MGTRQDFLKPSPVAKNERLIPSVQPDDHAYGPAEAPITGVQYGDYECPASRQVYEVEQQAMEGSPPKPPPDRGPPGVSTSSSLPTRISWRTGICGRTPRRIRP